MRDLIAYGAFGMIGKVERIIVLESVTTIVEKSRPRHQKEKK
jgi:hypothetical protein